MGLLRSPNWIKASRLAQHASAQHTIQRRNTSPGSYPCKPTKRSGLGRESGLEAIKEYLQVKSVWIATESSVANPFIIR